jgi:hypothetical protein
MVDINSILTYNPDKVQSAVNFVFWAIIALICIGVFGYILYITLKKMSYKLDVTTHKKVGDIAVKDTDRAKKITDGDGNYFFHYLKLNKKSPIVKDSYLKIVKKKWLGIFPMSQLGFDVWVQDGKVIPMDYNFLTKHSERGIVSYEKVALTGIDYDAFNFLQSQIKLNMAKYQRQDKLMQILPYAALFLVIMAFILGMIFYTKHIENISMNILGYAKETAQKGLENSGIIQTLTGQ